MLITLLFLLIVFGIPILIIIGIYNKLVVLRNRGDNAWHQIDVQLQRRADLVPNLVETVKGYAAHEKGVFEAVTKARIRSNIRSAGLTTSFPVWRYWSRDTIRI